MGNIEYFNVIISIVSILNTVLIFLAGALGKVFYDLLRGLQREVDKLNTRVNAQDVSIAKVQTLKETLERLEQTQGEQVRKFDLFYKQFAAAFDWAKRQVEK